MVRVLITGLTGMVGSHLADYLLEHTDWEIHGLLRWRSPLDNIVQLLPRINAGDRVFLHYGDLCDTLSIIGTVIRAKPDYCYHLAAQSYPLTSFTAPLDTIDTNVNGTIRLLDALERHAPACRIHVCSSSEVYGRVSQDKLPIDEDCPFHPASPYAVSKVGADLMAQHYAQAYGMHIQVTRMFTHSGPRRGDIFAESSFAKQIAMIEQGLIPPVVKVGNLDSLRTWADVRDAVRAYHMLLTVNPKAGAVYNIGGEYTCTVKDMLTTLVNLSTFKGVIGVKTDPARLRPLDADLQVPDTRKFRRQTGWEATIPFQQTMTDLLNYWRERVQKGAIVR